MSNALDDTKLGPAMSSLNPRQRSFVIAYCATGGKNAVGAARTAGYEGTDVSLRVQAHRLAHSEAVQAAIHEEVGRRQQALAPRAQSNIEKIANNPLNRNSFEANKLLLALAGHSAVQKSEHKVTQELTTKEMIEEIRKLGATLGDKVVKSLLPPTIDITPTSSVINDDF